MALGKISFQLQQKTINRKAVMKILRKILSSVSSFVISLFERHQQLPTKIGMTKNAPSPLPPPTELPAEKPPKQVVFRNKPAFGGFNWGPLVAIPRKSNGHLKTVLFETRNHKFLSAKVRGVEGPNVVISRHGSRPFKRRLVPA